jgi:hypothetical protein
MPVYGSRDGNPSRSLVEFSVTLAAQILSGHHLEPPREPRRIRSSSKFRLLAIPFRMLARHARTAPWHIKELWHSTRLYVARGQSKRT